MIFRPFYYYDKGCAAYLLGCGTRGTCAVVDPRADDLETYRSFARSKHRQITQVIDTHVHADHHSGGAELAAQTQAAYRLHEAADVDVPFTPMRDGDEIELGNTRLRVLHTPGHSPESVSLHVTDLKRGTDPWFVLTGDTHAGDAASRRGRPTRRLRKENPMTSPSVVSSQAVPDFAAGRIRPGSSWSCSRPCLPASAPGRTRS